MAIRIFTFFVCLLCLVSPAFAATELTVYTNAEPELLARHAKAFETQNPGITLKWVRDSAGPITARLLAEKEAPKADVIFGLSLASILALEEHGLLEPYAPKGREKTRASMRDNREQPLWSALNAWGSAFCVNTSELSKKNLPMPATWKDLTNPVYKGHLAIPSPVSSSTGLMNVNAWLQQKGEEEAWAFMDALDSNIKMYVHSGCKPCQMAAMGEVAIGISSDVCARVLLERKAPLVLVQPTDGIGWDAEGAALVKGSQNPEAARKLIDFVTSDYIADVAVEYGYIPAREDKVTEAAKKTLALFVPMDFSKAAKQRDATIAKWRERFEKR